MSQSIREKFKNEGPVGLAVALLIRLPKIKRVNFYSVYKCEQLLGSGKKYGDLDAEIKIVSDISGLGIFNSFPARDSVFRGRLMMGHVAVAMVRQGEAIAYLWADGGGSHREQRFGYKIPLSASELFYYDSFVEPQFRGKGLLRQMLVFLSEFGNEKLGKPRLVATIDMSNLNSRRVHKSLGFAPVASGAFIQTSQDNSCHRRFELPIKDKFCD